MPVRHRFVPRIAVILAIGFAVASLEAVQKRRPLIIIQYEVSASTDVGGVTEYELRGRLLNVGPSIDAASARLTGWGPDVEVRDGTLTFGPVGHWESDWSTDTFTVRLPAGALHLLSKLQWTIEPSAGNQRPTAAAGDDQTVTLFDIARLDGSGSTDPEGDPLTYAWSWIERPVASAAQLDDPGAVRPSFTVDAAGRYVLALVVHDGSSASDPDMVEITTGNSAPIADAGEDRTVTLGDSVQLDGSGSSDPDGDPLTYAWTLASRPAASSAVLDDPSAVRPVFVADAPGSYVVQLVVHDGLASSTPDAVVLRTDNSAPVADAGPDQSVALGATVTLDGSGSSDVDGDALTYAWALLSQPSGSGAALDVPTAVSPTFVVDLPGVYVAQLIVNDGTAASAADTLTITTLNSRPVADAGRDQVVVAGHAAAADGTASFDADGDPLTFHWSLTRRPAGSAATLADPGAPVASFVTDVPGDYTLQLIVSDGELQSLPDTALVTTTNAPPVADAGPDRLGLLVGTLATLDGSSSSDPDGHGLSFTWSLISRPSGSAASLTDTTVPSPSLTLDIAGYYVVQLIVHDGFASSLPDTVRLQAVEPVVVTIVATDDDASEIGPDPGAFTITRTGPTTGALDVNLLIDGTATNGEDYAAIPDVVTIPAGSATVVIEVLPVDDGLFEGQEGVILAIQPGAGYSVGIPGIAQVLIADSSRPVVTVTASVPTAYEAGAQPGAFTLARTGPTVESLQIIYARSGTASDGLDYVSFSGAFGIVTIPEGETSVVLPIVPLLDNVVEGDETVTLTISAGAAYLVGEPAAATVTIVDDPARVSVEAVQPDASEQGPVAGMVAVRRSGGDLGAALALGLTFGGTASLADFVTIPPVTIPAGQVEVLIAITPRRDNLVEGPETVVVAVTERASYIVDGGAATVTIADDPPLVNVVATDPDASETGPDPGVFTFSRAGGNFDEPLLVFFTRTGTAGNGTDYVSIGGSTSLVTIPAGASSATVTITPIPDSLVEPPETVVVTIAPRTAYVIAAPGTATVVITDGP